MAMLAELVDGVIGVDPHRDTLTAAAVTNLGGVLAKTTTSADATGYQQLLGFGRVQVPGHRLWAVEGAGSFGAGLTAALQHCGERVVEVGRPKRPASRTGAKSDALDAVRAAREALGHDRPAIPRRRGEREALRALLTTRRSATTIAPTCGPGRPDRWSTRPPCAPCGPPPGASSSWPPRPTSCRPSSPYWSRRPPPGCWRSPASAP